MSDNKPYLIELSLYNKKNPFEINKFCSVSFDTSKVNLSKEKKNKILAELYKEANMRRQDGGFDKVFLAAIDKQFPPIPSNVLFITNI